MANFGKRTSSERGPTWSRESPARPGRYWFYGWWGEPSRGVAAELYHVIVREMDPEDRKLFGYVARIVYECDGTVSPVPFKTGRWAPVGYIHVPSYELAMEIVSQVERKNLEDRATAGG